MPELRHFFLPLVLGLIFLAAFNAQLLFGNGSSGPTPMGFPIIDAHVHLDFNEGFERDSGFEDTMQEFLKQTQEAGVRGFVAHTSDDKEPTPQLPGLVQTFCAGIKENFSLARVEEGLQNGKYKCIKIYLGYVHRFAYDKAYGPLYDLAEKYAVPVVFHTGDTDTREAKVKYSDPLTIDEVAVDHPSLNIVMAHCGNPWFASAAEVAYKNPNVYLDASGIMIGDFKKYPRAELRKYVIEPVGWTFGYIENPQKMMFGTDWPLVNIKQYLDVVIQGIPAAAQKAFLYENAARVFKIQL